MVTGSGDIAPGVGAKVLVDFTPDSLGEYHDVISVVTEVGTFEVRRWSFIVSRGVGFGWGSSSAKSLFRLQFETCPA